MGKKSNIVNQSKAKKVVYKQYLPGDSSDDFSDDDDEVSTKHKAKKARSIAVPNEESKCSPEENDPSDNKEKDGVLLPMETILSDIRNKVRRKSLYNKMKKEKKKAKKQLKKLIAKEEEISGKKKKVSVPHTIESKREEDITMINESDEDLVIENVRDEFAEYYSKKYEPKVLITASNCIHGRTAKFIKELALIVPNSVTKSRNSCGLEKLVRDAPSNGFTDILIINEDKRLPTGMLVIHLPDGPSALFRVSNVKVCKDMGKNIKDFTGHRPEIILSNFRTRLGCVIARMFGALFHYEPEFKGRSVCTFHNQRDYIFFRYHRYEFKDQERVKIKELGPRFTLRLEWLKKGAFGGDYEWNLKRHEMETSRRKFFL